MLLTLAARSVRSLISRDGKGSLTLPGLPEFAVRHLRLRGINVPSSMLAGWRPEDLDRLRDQGDKAGCPCLVLIEDTPLRFEPGGGGGGRGESAVQRVQRLAVAASRLGCNALAIRCEAPDAAESLEETAGEIRSVMPAVERFELNLLISPHTGLTQKPERLTELLKRIGGFRIGSLPDFAHAASCGNMAEALRKLVPYAGAVHATVLGFDEQGRHKSYDLAEAVAAIRSVGFLNTLAIDYIGNGDPLSNIEAARRILQEAIDAEEKQHVT
jgi:sugar phosphate isomerase/epimerase